MIRRHKLRRILAPTAGLKGAITVAVVGTLVFAIGFTLSFKLALLPLVQALSNAWNRWLGSFVSFDNIDTANHFIGGAMLALGIYMIYTGIMGFVKRMVATLNPGLKSESDMVNTFVRKQQLAQGPRVVALGGGTGLSTLLRGLKQHTSNITAVVTVTDDGGSSGKLVKEMGIIPPGDIRNCLVALADAEKLMTDLFQHRFKNASGSLSGHSLGNLLIAGLVEQSNQDFDKALTMASEVLNIRGKVIPSTLSQVRLRALMEDGTEVCGETTIVASGRRIRRIYLDPEDTEPFPAVLDAIEAADLICIGPGSVYTSVIPNLLVPGIAEAINASNARKVYICNVMTQPGESDAFTAAEHLVTVQANVDERVADYVVVNTGMPSSSTIEEYKTSDQFVVEPDVDRIRAMGYRVITGNFVNELDYVRHDPFKVAARLIQLLEKR